MKGKDIAKHELEHDILGVTKKIHQALFKSDGGGTGGAIGTELDPIFEASEAAKFVAGDKAVLDALAYITPAYSIFTNNQNNLEIGTTVTSVVLNWTKNKTFTSQSLNQSIGAIGTNILTYTHTDTFTTSRTYTITGSDGTNIATKSTSVNFLPKRYWGLSADDTLDDAEIIALSDELSASRGKTLPTLTPATQYIYYCYPTSEGTLTSITVNGLIDTSWNLSVQSFTNALGYTQNYNIYRSANLLVGTYNIILA